MSYYDLGDVERIERKCERCGEWFHVAKEWDRPRICPICITRKDKKFYIKTCLNCKKEFNAKNKNAKFCSMKCYRYFMYHHKKEKKVNE